MLGVETQFIQKENMEYCSVLFNVISMEGKK